MMTRFPNEALVDCSCEHSKQPSADDTFNKHCSDIARERAEACIGTANRFDRFVLVEIGLPWPEQMRMVPWARSKWPQHIMNALNDAVEDCQRQRVPTKFIAIAADRTYSDLESPHVVVLERGSHHARMERITFPLFEAEGLAQLRAICSSPLGSVHGTSSSSVRDLLVCTHGQIDSCCGRLGIPLFQHMRHEADSLPDVHIWRCSAIGGHRFAPTVIDFPEGRMWGHLELEDVPNLLARKQIDTLIPKYRGSVCVRSRIEQIAEREVFRMYGWDIRNVDIAIRTEHQHVFIKVSSHRQTKRYRISVLEGPEQHVVVDCKGSTSMVKSHHVITELVEGK